MFTSNIITGGAHLASAMRGLMLLIGVAFTALILSSAVADVLLSQLLTALAPASLRETQIPAPPALHWPQAPSATSSATVDTWRRRAPWTAHQALRQVPLSRAL